CTAIFDDGLFGRTLDLERSYGENVVITPRGFKFNYLYEKDIRNNAIIGVAHIENGIPLYYDAMNENGLCAAGLNFPKYAIYNKRCQGKINVASFEVIPFILKNCDDVDDTIKLLKDMNITNDSFSSELSATPMHWLIGDKKGVVVVESGVNGIKIHKNPYGVMTNSPDYDYHKVNLSNYMGISGETPENKICNVDLQIYSRGLGGFGLPGDFSSASRFVRSVFLKNHTVKEDDKIGRFFHIMDNVSVPKGCIITDTGEAVYTVYTSCMDMVACEYNFTTYDNRNVKNVGLYDYDLDNDKLVTIKI
ncbi:MAG: choloylglycine hydrolase family protein, partial [Clostridia bacterium]|nr:choloylglycine hydrolase family protein [Clostridia bacterium]